MKLQKKLPAQFHMWTYSHFNLSSDQSLITTELPSDCLTLTLSLSLSSVSCPSSIPDPCPVSCPCLLQVRSISLNVRKNVSLTTLSQDVLLKEFSSIS